MKRAVFFTMAAVCLSLALTTIHCDTNTAADVNAQVVTGTNAAAVQNENVVLVETVTLKPRTMRSFILLSSTIETENMVDVYPQVTGIVQSLNVEEGDFVRQNSSLVQLDDREQRLAVQKAEVSHNKRKNDFERVKKSFEKSLISKVEFDNAQFEMENARLLWEEAKLNLSYSKVPSPINGIVAERLVKKGDRVQQSQKLFRIVDHSEKIAVVYIPEKEITTIERGQDVILTSEFLKDESIPGSIKRVSPVIDPASGTFKVTVGIDDPGNRYRPGMFVSVRIITAVREGVIAVPKDALVYDSGVPFVFLAKDGKAKRIPLNAGFSDERYVEARDGLREGDSVIVVGQSGLKDNTQIKVVSAGGN